MEQNSAGTEKYHCRRCAKPLDYRIPRQQIVKAILFWVPLKRYKCTSCEKKQYIVVKK